MPLVTIKKYGEYRFQIFLVVLLSFFAIAPFFENKLLLDIFTTSVVVFAVLGLNPHRKLLILGSLLGITAVSLIWLESLIPSKALLATTMFVQIVYYLLIIGTILSSVFRAHFVNRETLSGAVCAYLLFGFLWANVYAGLENLSPGSFSGHIQGSTIENESLSFRQQVPQFSYFSLVTLSTLGYGDITPMTRPARNLAALEAIFGQLYIAILITRLVSQYIRFDSQQKR